MARIRFPKGFHWGAATAAYAIEGAHKEDGKGESIWDDFTHRPGTISSGETGDVACDSYHRWPEDVALLRASGATSYRFSIAWTRVQPEGHGPPRASGLDHYRRVVEALLEVGIRPVVTLYHWDLPQALERRGGWPERDTAGRFADYTDAVVRSLGDVVETWCLLDEPSVFTMNGYRHGIHAPGRSDREDFLRATHTVNLAQAEACRALRASRPGARVGTALRFSPCEPAGDSDADADAAERQHAFANTWFLEPALRGRYPEAFPDGVPERAMAVRDRDYEQLRAEWDFLGVNLYTSTRVRAVAGAQDGLGALPVDEQGGRRESRPTRTDSGWEVRPRALYDMVMRLTRDYDTPALEITANGCAYDDAPGSDGCVRDERRIAFHRDHLAWLARAIEDGADVRGYHVWSLLDHFAWDAGTRARFGLAWVDFPSGRRILKDSGRWLAAVAETNGFET